MVSIKHYAGVYNINEMGTTGLISWVVLGGFKEHVEKRLFIACKVVKSRNPKAVVPFIKVVKKEMTA